MGNIHVALIIFIFLLLFLNGSVGKCLSKSGKLKCNSKQICVAGKTPCVPYDMSQSCRCKKNKVRGCEDSLGRSVCKYDEECLVKKNGKRCSNPSSRSCKCKLEKPTPTKEPVKQGIGCFVGVDLIKIFIPFDFKYHAIKELPCKECICKPAGSNYVDYCRIKPNCNSAVHLFLGR